jgi:ribosome maturation factor RimP
LARVRAAIDDLFREDADFTGLFVVDLKIRGHSGSRVIEVYVDGDQPVPIEQITLVSRRFGSRLEDAGVIDGVARLEVSSPGASRPLVELRQYPKHTGKVVTIKRGAPGETVAISGILRAVTADALELEVDGAREIIPFNEIVEGKVALPW